MILLIDNYDSFVYNLARYVGQLGQERHVVRNDAITLEEIAAEPPEAIIISPGPCTPRESGICPALIREFYKTIPILGICLGHQCLGEAFGAQTVRAPTPRHGKTSEILHDGTGIFSGIPSPFRAARYHSLIIRNPDSAEVKITAGTDGLIMGIEHLHYPAYGLQFHPESVLTDYGPTLMRNFIDIAARWNERRIAA